MMTLDPYTQFHNRRVKFDCLMCIGVVAAVVIICALVLIGRAQAQETGKPSWESIIGWAKSKGGQESRMCFAQDKNCASAIWWKEEGDDSWAAAVREEHYTLHGITVERLVCHLVKGMQLCVDYDTEKTSMFYHMPDGTYHRMGVVPE